MKALLFNVHDLVLLLTLGICVLLAGIFAVQPGTRRAPNYLLGGFFVLNALIALDKLIFWGEAFKYQVFEFFPPLLLLFSFADFVVGPVLYWYVCSRIFLSYSFRTKESLHLIPALATPVYLYLVCFQFPTEVQHELLLELKIYDKPWLYFNDFITFKKMMPIIYAVVAFSMLIPQTKKTNGVNHLSHKEIIWLKALTGGFSFVWLWALGTHLYGSQITIQISDFMGIAGNYMTLILIAGLVFYDLAWLGERTPTTLSSSNEEDEAVNAEQAKQIRALVESEKPYLNPRLTLGRFSELVDLSPRQVSLVINRCFDQNFHEYINRYRVEEAKRMLSNDKDLTIQEVAQRSGFNSKATFNRFFKNIETLTPSEFRQNHSTLQAQPSR